MNLTDLLRTKAHLVGLEGLVKRHPFGWELRTPRVPTYFHGNCLLLDATPADFGEVLGWHREVFGEEVDHRLLVWAGEPVSPGVLASARGAGFRGDEAIAMVMSEPPAPNDPKDAVEVRPLQPADWGRIDELSRACNASDADDGDPAYLVFVEGIRDLRRRWVEAAAVVWWGAFVEGRLAGQCGLAVCDSAIGQGLGRYQSVEVHPSFRRRGVATTLVTAVARHALQELGCERILLEADGEGPALRLYERMGFRRVPGEHSLLWSRGGIHVRAESVSDHADVRALMGHVVRQSSPEASGHGGDPGTWADQVAAWRGESHVRSFIAEQDGKVLGHLLVTVAPKPSGSVPASGDAPRPAAVDGAVLSLVIRPSAEVPEVKKALLDHAAILSSSGSKA